MTSTTALPMSDDDDDDGGRGGGGVPTLDVVIAAVARTSPGTTQAHTRTHTVHGMDSGIPFAFLIGKGITVSRPALSRNHFFGFRLCLGLGLTVKGLSFSPSASVSRSTVGLIRFGLVVTNRSRVPQV